MIEIHNIASFPNEIKIEFIKWVISTGVRPKNFNKHCENLYHLITKEFCNDKKLKTYINCLAWYYQEWPEDDEEFLNKIIT